MFTTTKAVGVLAVEDNENSDPATGVEQAPENTDGVALVVAWLVPERLQVNGAAAGAVVLELLGTLARLNEKLVAAADGLTVEAKPSLLELLIEDDD